MENPRGASTFNEDGLLVMRRHEGV